MNFILLPIKWINKIFFLFSKNIYLFIYLKAILLINKTIFLIYLNTKTSLFS